MKAKYLFFYFILFFCYKQSIGQSWSSIGFGAFKSANVIIHDSLTNNLYVAGYFNSIGTISIKSVAKWDGSKWDSLGSGLNSTVRALAIYNGELYAGGFFTASGLTAVNYIAKWDGINWVPLGAGLNGTVFDMEEYNGELYVIGNFSLAGGISANNIAKWNGTNWSDVGGGLNVMSSTLQKYKGELYAGGNFSEAGGIPSNNIAKWNGLNWSIVGNGVNSAVRALGIHNNELFIGGDFDMANGNLPANRIVKYDGVNFDTLSSGLDESPEVIYSFNCELYVGGTFSLAGGLAVRDIAKWNSIGGWSNVGNPRNSAFINAMCAIKDSLFVGGSVYPPNESLQKWVTTLPIAPSASFKANDSLIKYGNYLQFYNTSINATSYKWFFSGGTPSSSIEKNPKVFYNAIGTYTVKLISYNCSQSDTLEKLNYIIVDSTIHKFPFGNSSDFLTIKTEENTEIHEGDYFIHYYKPSNYNPLNGNVLIYIHGLGSSGESSDVLQDIANRNNSLIVAPNMHNGSFGWAYVGEILKNSNTGCYERFWYTQVLKDIYRHVLEREQRDSADVYLTGFSAGGQFVTRYMLVRQFSQDSMPIKMAMSVNPSNYTLMTDTFNNSVMNWYSYRCGLAGSEPLVWGCGMSQTKEVKDFICNEHVKQYYNENYGVLIGTADTQPFSGFCPAEQGTDRYDRAKKFFDFSVANSISRGTTLKWVFDSVVGIGHDNFQMYNSKLNVSDSYSIAEKLLYQTPYHNVEQFSPKCYKGTSVIEEITSSYKFQNNKGIVIFPNPNNGEFVLELGNNVINGIYSVQITDAMGRMIMQNNIKQNSKQNINLQTHGKGIYFVKIFGDQLNEVHKVVIN